MIDILIYAAAYMGTGVFLMWWVCYILQDHPTISVIWKDGMVVSVFALLWPAVGTFALVSATMHCLRRILR